MSALLVVFACARTEPPDRGPEPGSTPDADTDVPDTDGVTDTDTGEPPDTGPLPGLPRWSAAIEVCGNATDDDRDGLTDESCAPALWAGMFVPDPGWLDTLAVDLGRPLPVVQTYRSTTPAGTANLALDLDRIFGDGGVAHVNVEPSGYTADQYATAADDAAIGVDLAATAAVLGDRLAAWPAGRLLLTFGAESNGAWTDWGCLPAATYVAFHERFHTLVDTELADRGLDPRRVRWVFGPDSRGTGGCPSAADYWPGADLLGLSAYRSGTDSVETTVTGPARALMDALGWPERWRRDRFVVLQTGSRTEDREAWTTALYDTLAADPTAAGVIWFDAADWAVLEDAPLPGYETWVDAVSALPVPDAALEGTFEPWFWDVGRDRPDYPEIQSLRSAGHTSGCSTEPPLFCPDDPLTRADAATFLARALALDAGAEALAGLADRPDEAVTRIELARAIAAAVAAPTTPAAFTDLDPATADRLGALVDAGWITGCGPDTFCPDLPLDRAVGAAWIVRAGVPAAPSLGD